MCSIIIIKNKFKAFNIFNRSVDRQSEDKEKSIKISTKDASIKEKEELKINTTRVLISSEPNTALIPINKHFEGIEQSSSKIEEEGEFLSKSVAKSENQPSYRRFYIQDYPINFAADETENLIVEETEPDEPQDISEQNNDPEYNRPIICSINQLKSIIRLTISSDAISKDMRKVKEQDEKFKYKIQDLKSEIKKIKSDLFNTFTKVCVDASQTAKMLIETQDKLEESKENLTRNINRNSDNISKLNSHSKEMDDFKKDMHNKIGGIVVKIKEQRAEYYQSDKEVEERAQDKINYIRNEMNQKFDVVNKEVEKMKTFVTQMCEMIKVVTTEMVENEIGRVSEIFEKVKEDLVTKTDNILARNKKSISNIKNTCATFFEKYDKALQVMQRRFDNINETFDNYEKNTIQPVQIREARLHFIECQLKEQESSRTVEYDFMKELIKRLIISLEQSVFISGIECVALAKRTSNKCFARKNTKEHSPIEEGVRGFNKSKQSIITSKSSAYDGNKSMIEPSRDSFLPYLSRNPHNQSNIIQHRDESALNEHKRSTDTSPLSDKSSKERCSKTHYKGLKLSGDKILLKRLLFLKESLERSPHIDETEDIKNQFKSAQKIMPSESASTVDQNANKIVKVTEPILESNFFKTPSINFLVNQKKKSHSVIRKGYDSDKTGAKENHHQHNNSSGVIHEGIFPNNHYSVAEQTMRDTGRAMKNLVENDVKDYNLYNNQMSTQDNNTIEGEE